MSKQPTATAFARKQESWAEYALSKVRQKIKDTESDLREQGIPEDDFYLSTELYDLYDDELFYSRYEEEMAKQREFLRKRYFNE